VIGAKGWMLRFEPSGHEVMKSAAREKTDRTPRGVSKGEGTAEVLAAVRMNVWWRDSTVTISAATVRIEGSDINGAAPRYAETPMFSKTAADASMAAALVKPKL